LIPRRLAASAVLASLLPLSGCASRAAARHFVPAGADEARETLDALAAVERRAADLPAARLLYDAKMGGKGAPSVPGTLAVTYDGTTVRRASLTGPFGSRVAVYDSGKVTGEDHRALVVDPGSLRAVLAGTWPGEPASIDGCDGADCLAVWNAPLRVTATVDRREQRLDGLDIAAEGGRLTVTYEGAADPWPRRIFAREEKSGRSLKLSLVAVEPSAPAVAAGP
jgi:hypothetical protein